jgi:hypothetical protein
MADQNRNQEVGRHEAPVQTTSESRRNPADNLTREARIRGGERSARMQNRDARGQFAGRRNEGGRSEPRANAGRNAGEPTGENR